MEERQEKRWWKWSKSGSKSRKGWEERRRKGGRSKHWLWMNAIFFLFTFSPSSPRPSPQSQRTRGTASSRQAEKEKRGREKEGLWRRDKGLSISVCHLIHRPLLRPAGPSVICCHIYTQKNRHTLSTHFHTLSATTTSKHRRPNFHRLPGPIAPQTQKYLFHTLCTCSPRWQTEKMETQTSNRALRPGVRVRFMHSITEHAQKQVSKNQKNPTQLRTKI